MACLVSFCHSSASCVVNSIEYSWTVGPNWPNGGEIDIIEGVNEQSRNKPAFHVGVDCRITGAGQTGKLTTSNCYVYDPNQPTNAGCGAEDLQESSYGRKFNEAGGGVYAMDWTSNAVRVWFFSRSKIPSDVSLQDPKPETWGDPVFKVQGGCNLNSVFRNQKLVRSITLFKPTAEYGDTLRYNR